METEVTFMESTLLEFSLTQGIWAAVAVFLFIYIFKSNEKRDQRQEEREEKYQSLLSEMTQKYDILIHLQSDITQIKQHILKN